MALWYFTTGATQLPLRFMNVMGFTSMTFTAPSIPVASSPLNEDEFFQDAPISRASASTTSKPMECGVFA